MAKNSIGMALATEEYGSKLFANDARPSVVLEHPGVLKEKPHAPAGQGNYHFQWR
jgi:phage portal protein BeeE